MNFYVPTIGDKIYLKKEWTFTLHRERRNEGLAKRIQEVGSIVQNEYMYHKVECIKDYEEVFNNGVFKHINPWTKGVIYTWDISSQEYKRRMETGNFKFVKESPHRWKSFKWTSNEAAVSLPRGTELTIDRIYIKKGAPTYDSITWRITDCPNKKLIKARFWTKLKDANRIVCELHPIHDLDAPAIQNRFETIDIE